jgi:hypothetical protein
MDELEWSFELSTDTLRIVRRELEWALQHQRDRVVRRLPQNKLALRTRQRAGFAAALFLLAFGSWQWATQPGQPTTLVAASLVFSVIGLVAVPFLPRYFAWTWRTIGRRLARRAEQLVRPIEDAAPATIHYQLRDARLEMRIGECAPASLALRDARLIITTPNATFAFRHAVAPEPIAIVCGDSGKLVEALANAGATLDRVEGPVARYGEWTALPTATAR